MQEYTIKKLIRSKIQKYLNITLANDKISVYEREKSQKQNPGAYENVDIYSIFQSRLNKSGLDEKLKEFRDSNKKDFDNFFDQVKISSNYLIDNGLWENENSFDTRQEMLFDNSDQIDDMIPEPLKDDSQIKKHLKEKLDNQEKINKLFTEIDKVTEQAKTYIETIKEYAADPSVFEFFYKRNFEISSNVRNKEENDRLFFLREGGTKADILYGGVSHEFYTNFVKTINKDSLRRAAELPQKDIEDISSVSFQNKLLSDLKNNRSEESLKDIISLNESLKELAQLHRETLTDLITKLKINRDEFLTTGYDPELIEVIDKQIYFFMHEEILLKKYVNYLNLTENVLKTKIDIIKIDNEINEYLNVSLSKVTNEKEKEEIRKVLDDIDDEELIKVLSQELKKYDVKTEDITEFLLNEVIQSITTDPYDTADIYEFLTNKNVEKNIYGGNEDNCKIKIITNLAGRGSVSKKLCIKKEKIKEDGNYEQRFGLFSKDTNAEGYFHIGENISQNRKSVTYKKNGKTLYSKKNPLMSYVMVLDPSLKASSRNQLELSVFLNSLSTIELSKSTPYFNAMFILPDAMVKGGRVFKTASITQFLNGTNTAESESETELYGALKSKYNKTFKKRNKSYTGTKSSMSIFNAPQTLNNFDDIYVGKQNTLEKETNKLVNKYVRANNVHDITRPFMTLKSFNIDVAPTQGLLSMKTGKINLVIHDRTRMVDIAPFIKPDMFGAFGAEIIVEYGWNNIESQSEDSENFIGEFIDTLKVREKYIITNSSFTITKNGEVNIDLSVAMRGPIDIKQTFLTSDANTTIGLSEIKTLYDSIEALKSSLNEKSTLIDAFDFKETISSFIYNKLIFGKTEKEFIESAKSNDIESIKKYIQSIDSEIMQKKSSEFKKECENIISAEQTIADKIKSFHKIFSDSFINQDYKDVNENENVFFVAAQNLNDDNLPKDFLKKACNLLTNYRDMFKAVDNAINNAVNVKETQKKFVNEKIIRPLGKFDAFFDRKWSSEYKKLLQKNFNNNPTKISQFTSLSVEEDNNTDDGDTLGYVTLGTILSSIVGVHLKETNKYDDIQVVSYNVNKKAGLMSNKNISSFLISRKDLKDLSEDIFLSRSKITLEGFLSRIIEKFISNEKQICYGFRDIFIDKEKSTEDVAMSFDQRLSDIDLIMTGKKENYADFNKPKIKMFFDTFVKKDAAEKSILRITLYDENDNPFQNLSEAFTNDNDLLKLTTQLNRLKVSLGRDSNEFKEKSYKIYKKLIDKGIVKTKTNKDGEIKYFINVKDKIKAKSEIKKIVPTITYGSQNSGIIDANVTSINEGNLSTVLMTRNDQRKNVVGDLKVVSNDNLPLQILPSKASITMFGCPIVNFAQYMFLDFDTGTTIDNFYAVTGMTHNLTPGNFTTNLTLSYGDAYGKYSSALIRTKELVQNIIGGKNRYVLNLDFKKDIILTNNVIDIQSLNKNNVFLQTNFNNIAVKKGSAILPAAKIETLGKGLEISVTPNIKYIYKQTIILTGKGKNQIVGEHLGSVISAKCNINQDYIDTPNKDIMIVELHHVIFRSENIQSVNTIPFYNINLIDILNKTLYTPENFVVSGKEDQISTGENRTFLRFSWLVLPIINLEDITLTSFIKKDYYLSSNIENNSIKVKFGKVAEESLNNLDFLLPEEFPDTELNTPPSDYMSTGEPEQSDISSLETLQQTLLEISKHTDFTTRSQDSNNTGTSDSEEVPQVTSPLPTKQTSTNSDKPATPKPVEDKKQTSSASNSQEAQQTSSININEIPDVPENVNEESDAIVQSQDNVTQNKQQSPSLETPSQQQTLPNELPDVKDFNKTFENLRLSYNVSNNLFYTQKKKVFLYDFLIPGNEKKAIQYIADYLKSGVEIKTENKTVTYKNGQTKSLGVKYIELPQNDVSYFKDLSYKGINYIVYRNLNIALEKLKEFDESIDVKSGRAIVTSAHRDPIYQQHIINTQGGRGKGKAADGERDFVKAPFGKKIGGVASVFGSKHNSSIGVDLEHKTDFNEIKSIDNTLKAFRRIYHFEDSNGENLGFRGFGIYKTHIHIDMRKRGDYLWIQVSTKKDKKTNKSPFDNLLKVIIDNADVKDNTGKFLYPWAQQVKQMHNNSAVTPKKLEKIFFTYVRRDYQ